MENQSEILFYKTKDGKTNIQVRLEEESNVQKIHIANSKNGFDFKILGST